MLATTRFAGLLTSLRLTPAERAAGEAAITAVRSCLDRGPAARMFRKVQVIGAWSKATEIRPPRDIDLMVVLPGRRPEAPPGTNAALEVYVDLKTALAVLSPDVHLRRDGRALKVPVGEVVVEISAAYRSVDACFDVLDAGGGGRIRVVAPDAERAWLDESDRRTHGCTRELVRLVKCWQSYRRVPISSLALELIAIDFLASWPYAVDAARYPDWMVRDAFGHIVRRASATLDLPGTGERLDLGQGWSSLARVAHQHAVKACDLETASRDHDAWWEWQQIFGDPVPIED